MLVKNSRSTRTRDKDMILMAEQLFLSMAVSQGTLTSHPCSAFTQQSIYAYTPFCPLFSNYLTLSILAHLFIYKFFLIKA